MLKIVEQVCNKVTGPRSGKPKKQLQQDFLQHLIPPQTPLKRALICIQNVRVWSLQNCTEKRLSDSTGPYYVISSSMPQLCIPPKFYKQQKLI